jgi:hypothetical protein
MNWGDNEDFEFDDLSKEERDEMAKEMRAHDERRRSHPLMRKAHEVCEIANALCESIEEGFEKEQARLMMESAMVLAAKFAGAFECESWLLSMQNAAIIRYHAQYVHTGTSGLMESDEVDQSYVNLLRKEMEAFRQLFCDWCNEIHQMPKDELDDEWGLFKINN